MSFTIIFYFYLAFLSSVGKLDIYAPPFHRPSLPIITVKLIFYSKKEEEEEEGEREKEELEIVEYALLIYPLENGQTPRGQFLKEDQVRNSLL